MKMKMKSKMRTFDEKPGTTRVKVAAFKAATVGALVLATGAPHKFR